jgi:hypothetical protein
MACVVTLTSVGSCDSWKPEGSERTTAALALLLAADVLRARVWHLVPRSHVWLPRVACAPFQPHAKVLDLYLGLLEPFFGLEVRP